MAFGLLGGVDAATFDVTVRFQSRFLLILLSFEDRRGEIQDLICKPPVSSFFLFISLYDLVLEDFVSPAWQFRSQLLLTHGLWSLFYQLNWRDAGLTIRRFIGLSPVCSGFLCLELLVLFHGDQVPSL